MEDKCKTGRVTIPTDLDVVPETLEILKKWGADAIRDCDGTDFPQELKKPGRYVMSVSDLLKKIQKLEPSIDISPIGETDFIITYRISSATGKFFRYVKILFVCLVSFFGAAFSIMTFNNDVDMGSLFSQFYTLVTGKSSSGFTILEISYSIGIGLGVLIFFNHFGHLKLSDDPTPMQVQMRTYEDDVNRTLIEQAARTENPETDS